MIGGSGRNDAAITEALIVMAQVLAHGIVSMIRVKQRSNGWIVS